MKKENPVSYLVTKYISYNDPFIPKLPPSFPGSGTIAIVYREDHKEKPKEVGIFLPFSVRSED